MAVLACVRLFVHGMLESTSSVLQGKSTQLLTAASSNGACLLRCKSTDTALVMNWMLCSHLRASAQAETTGSRRAGRIALSVAQGHGVYPRIGAGIGGHRGYEDQPADANDDRRAQSFIREEPTPAAITDGGALPCYICFLEFCTLVQCPSLNTHAGAATWSW
jgi:hypothetical protein